MAWQISHSPEAWDDARAELETWPAADLINALCDDRFETVEPKGGAHHAARASDALRSRLEYLAKWCGSHDALVDLAIEAIERNGLCSNGGHKFWIDPEGYHTVDLESGRAKQAQRVA